MANLDDVPVSIRLQSPSRPLQPRALHRAALRGAAVPERSTTPVGTVDAGVLAEVDDAGSVQLRGATWCLDWWIGAEDRWHHPAREAAVRQRNLDVSPVVETALRVPGGDVVARAFGVQASAGDWRGPGVVVEVENRTAVPVALAFVIRPVTLDGTGSVRSVRSSGADVVVDGRDRLLLSRTPPRVVSGRLGEVVGRLRRGEDRPGDVDVEVADADGEAEVAFVVPLTHTAVARVLLPVPSASPTRRRSEAVPSSPWEAPGAEAVARGWSTHAAGGMRIVAPEAGWEEGLSWAAAMLRLAGPDEVGACLDRRRPRPAGPSAAVRAAEVAEAMVRLGASDALAPVARGLAGAQRLGGAVRLGDRSDGTVALLHACAGALGGAGPDSQLVTDLLAPAAVAVRRLARGRGVDHGLSSSAVRALRMLVGPLGAVGQPEVAEDAAEVAARLEVAVDDGHAAKVGNRATSTDGAGRSTVAAAIRARSLVAAGAGTEAVTAVRECWAGVGTRGRSDLEVTTDGATASVPVGGIGFDVAELAARTNALLDLFVTIGADGPVLLPAFDRSWYGHSVEAHGMVSPWGPVGFAVRWHGARPALLWQVGIGASDVGDGAPTGPADVVALVSPGLDPSWHGAGATGDALLAAPPPDGAWA